ncbi:MAG TPA: asparaginase domain-containing protein [Elusimicrobiota bacterium]|nr:asparaginase domain-containing protein [Elusimicrobiota bacterium]
MIRILVTGGTFDKEYQETTGRLSFRRTHVPEMLRLGRARLPVRVSTLMMVDSLQMSAAQRRRVVRACRAAAEKRIVVTHGTDTMAETARALGPRVPGKTVVLTGAMVPYAFGSSDGLFNLGSALSFAQALGPGVYVAMNGTCFPWNDVRKNRAEGVFQRRRRSKA